MSIAMETNIEIKIIERLKYQMNIEKISQYALAKRLNIAQSTICNWLNGKKEPSIESLWKLANYFDITVDYLIGRSND